MAFVSPAQLALDGSDPRVDNGSLNFAHLDEKYIPSIEECLYWAVKEREHENGDTRNDVEAEHGHYGTLAKRIFRRNQAQANATEVSGDRASTPEKYDKDEKDVGTRTTGVVTASEKETAYRAFRTAGWISVFYLITTDILGPYSAPWAFSQLGYASGCLIFLFFGIIAAYTGFLLWWMYLKLDSSRFPIKTYSDLALRIYGRYAKHLMNILQSIQLLFNVAVIILGNGQGLSQIAKGNVCFSALCVIWTVVGMIIGQIRTLRNFGWLANGAIWLNVVVIIITMGVAAHSDINLTAAIASAVVPANSTLSNIPPIMHSAVLHIPFTNQIVGVMQIVYSYGGAMLFVEFMAEMRRPRDFWKAMMYAQLFIFFVYMLFGVFVYAFQGQYAVNPANQGLSPFAWQTATNVISLLAAIIAAGLYGNIGIKVFYINILEELLHFPSLASKWGRYIWTVTVICYWSLAFIIASAVPQFSSIASIVAALCILQFTYTFPPILFLGFHMHVDAIRGDRPFEPQSVTSHRVDSWRNISRWKRALGRHWYFKLANSVMFLAALATAGLGSYSSILGIINGFNNGSHATSFGCQSNVS